jgi:magnesium-protoporphyrin O-methyltransferase
MSCCTDCTNNHFGDKIALRDLNSFRTKGIKKSTKPLLQILSKLDLKGMHLLDIGGGIGVVSHGLRDSGLSEITHNDISDAYLNTFKIEFGSQLKGIKVDVLKGDFTEVSDQVDEVDIVTLDKSICCYPNYNDLVSKSIVKAKTWYAYVIPRDTWWVKLFHFFGELPKTFRGDPFKSFVYPVDKIERIVLDHGFTKYAQEYQREWLICVFRK